MRIFKLLVPACVLFLQSVSCWGEVRESLPLSGEWKFGAFIGDGSDFRQVKPQERDIIIDNDNTDLVEVVGNWSLSEKAERVSRHWGKNYYKRWFSEGDPTSYVRLHFDVPESGPYEVFVYYPFGIHQTTRFNVKHAEGITGQHLSQRNRCNQWNSLGLFELEKGRSGYVEFTAITDMGDVTADAVMLRPVDPEVLSEDRSQMARVATLGFDDSEWKDLLVPGHWGMLNEYSNYSGKGWYRKKFDLPSSWEQDLSKRVRLKFDGAYHVSRVFLNGEYLGLNRGGFTPFEFDVSNRINFGEENIIAVEVDNSAVVGATWNWGGLIRDVSVERVNDSFINYQYVHAEPDLESGSAELKIRTKLENRSLKRRVLAVKTEIWRDGELLKKLEGEAVVHPISETILDLTEVLTPEMVELWHFDRPVLYQIKTRLLEGEVLLDVIEDRFGIRKIEVTKDSLLLNGEPVRLAGFNRVSDHRYWGSSEPTKVLEEDMRLMKNAGANMTRIMHGTQNKRLLELCDEMGLMVIEEINVRELTNPEFTAPEYPLAKQWMRGVFERDCNHPSIIGWSVGNELRNHYGYVEELIGYVKEELDPYRLVSCVSNTGHRPKDTPENDPLGLSDLILENCYQKAASYKVVHPIHEKWPDKPIFFSEFGIRRFTDFSLDNDLPELAEWYSTIRGKNTFVVGASLWTYNDYRSGYSQTLEDENRAWGLVDVWRNKRRLYRRYQVENSPVRGINFKSFEYLDGKLEMTIPIRARDDYPSYTMRDYRLIAEFRGEDGGILQTVKTALPLLSPEDGEWKGVISWEANMENVFDCRIALLSANGFIRFEEIERFSVPSTPQINHVLAADRQVRVLFERKNDADEYYIRWKGSDGKAGETKKTFDSFLDIGELTNGNSYQLILVGVNEEGESAPSQVVSVVPQEKILPPVVQHAAFEGDKLVIGYSGEYEDEWYEVRYGKNDDSFDDVLRVVCRGMLVIDADSSVSFQIRRKTDKGVSQWSPVVLVN